MNHAPHTGPVPSEHHTALHTQRCKPNNLLAELLSSDQATIYSPTAKACSCCLALGQRPQVVLACAMGAVQVLANFGSSSFKCDVSSLESDALQCIQDQVQQTQVPLPVKVTTAHDNTCCLTMALLVLCLGEVSFSISQTAVLDKISIHHKPTNVGSRPRSCKQLKSPASLPIMSSV